MNTCHGKAKCPHGTVIAVTVHMRNSTSTSEYGCGYGPYVHRVKTEVYGDCKYVQAASKCLQHGFHTSLIHRLGGDGDQHLIPPSIHRLYLSNGRYACNSQPLLAFVSAVGLSHIRSDVAEQTAEYTIAALNKDL